MPIRLTERGEMGYPNIIKRLVEDGLILSVVLWQAAASGKGPPGNAGSVR